MPRIVKQDDEFELLEDCPKSIGRVRSFFGNFGILVRAYTYIISLGGDGLEESSRMALLNANYIRKKLEKSYQIAYDEPCMHECIFTDRLTAQIRSQYSRYSQASSWITVSIRRRFIFRWLFPAR